MHLLIIKKLNRSGIILKWKYQVS